MEHEDLMLYLLRGGNTKEDSRVCGYDEMDLQGKLDCSVLSEVEDGKKEHD